MRINNDLKDLREIKKCSNAGQESSIKIKSN